MLITTVLSEAKKTAGCAVTYRAASGNKLGTCDPSCPLMPADGTGSKRVDQAYLKALLAAVPVAGSSFTYTHYHPKHWEHQWEHRRYTGRPTTTINYSCDSLAQARVMVDSWHVPMVVAISTTQARRWGERPSHPWKVGYHGTMRVVRCPAEYQPKVTCATCGGAKLGGLPLCARPRRGYLIGFTAHGPGAAKVGSSQPGGCYATAGNVNLNWTRLSRSEPSDKVDGALLREFAGSLAPYTVLRHHVAGDMGE